MMRRSLPPLAVRLAPATLVLAAALALAAPPLRAQAAATDPAPTIRAESNGEVQLSTGTAPSFTVTTECPATGPGSRCTLWIEPAGEEGLAPRAVQWQLTDASGGCRASARGDFRDVVSDPELPIADVAKGASCTLTLVFRLTGATAVPADVVRGVSLFVTTPE